MQGFLILSGALLATAALAIFPNVRDWWRALIRYPFPAIIVILAVLGSALGVSKGVDLATAGSVLPEPRRLLRAIIFVSIFMLSAAGIIANTSRIKLAGKGAQWMLGYALLASLSAVYSVQAFVSFWKGFEVITFVLIAINISGYLQKAIDIRWLFSICGLIALYLVMTVIIGLVLYPEEAFRSADPLTGIVYVASRGLVPVMNPASQGAMASFVVLCTLVPLLSKEKFQRRYMIGTFVVLCLAVFLLLMARSRTQIFVCTISVVILLFLSRRIFLAILIGIGGVVAILLNSATVIAYILRGQTQEQFTGFTGRLEGWQLGLESVYESPLLGKGFYAGYMHIFTKTSVDNSYLEVMIGLGLIGLILFLIPGIIAIINTLKTRPKGHTFTTLDTIWLYIVGFFTFILIRSITTPGLATMSIILLYYLFAHIAVVSLSRLRYDQNISDDIVYLNKDKDLGVMGNNIEQPAPRSSMRILQKRRIRKKNLD